MIKKISCLIVSLLLCLSLVLTGCSTQASVTSSSPIKTATSTLDPDGEHTVTDNAGNEVTVPNTIDRIAIISTMPLASVYCMFTGSADKLVGLTPSSKNSCVNSMLIKIAPEIADVSTDFATGDAVNTEEVLKLDPDVVFYNTDNASDTAAAEKLQGMGIPCVGFSTTLDEGDVIKTVNSWVSLIGDVLGEKITADKFVAYGEEIEDMVNERVSKLSDSEKKSAVIITNYTSNGTITVAGNTFGRFWLKSIGADNVALSIEQKVANVNLEQIYAWDPDVIFLNSFSAFTADDIINSTAVKGQDWSGLTAIKNKDVYKMPMGMYYWFPPCSDSPLALLWMAKTLYPDLFKDIDMNKEIKDYYKDFYGITLTDDDLETIYNPPAASAMQ